MVEKFSVGKWVGGDGVKDWWRATGDALRLVIIGLVIFGVVIIGTSIYRFFFPKKNSNINKPTVITTPFSHIDKLDQSSVQVSVEESPWEVGVGLGAANFDNKTGTFIGGFIKRKF